ncbi:MAG: hypothetical protein NZM09_03420 [Ignavibacterium sp.]|nr:hypothetical protein [Ignavibacterium sp.]MDW8374729.1 hypothetical protein [Ignavibacteriales bacterium]
MGKSSLIIVLGLGALVAFIVLKLNSNTKEALSATTEMFSKTQARLIANSGVEIYLQKLKEDRTLLNKTFNNNSLFNGKYNIQITGPESLVTVRSVSNFMGYNHTTIVRARADKVGVYPLPSGFRIATNTVSGVKINGNITISGHNYQVGQETPIPGSTSIPGIGVSSNSHRTTILSNISGSASIIGAGSTPSVQVVNDSVNWISYAQALVSNPDIIINSSNDLNKYSNLGTQNSPKVTFINGSIKINSISGCGVLVVNGNLEINGNFTYVGLIIAYQNAKIITKLNGNGKVWGGIVIASNDVDLNISNGNFKCFYSSSALNLISSALETRRFQIVSWWE